MKNVKPEAIIGPMRLPFLILTPACLLIGVATAHWAGASLSPLHLVLVFLGGVSAHVCVNALNEYLDFKSGLDLVTEPTPFSGGSKTLPNNPEQKYVALATGIISLLITIGVGIYFLVVRGLGLLPIGLIGVISLVAYTRLFTRNPLICLIAPGLGFGPLMVLGTHFVLTGSYSWTAFFASLVPFFLVNNLLLLNQFPDAEADRTAGRRHLPIVIGIPGSVKVYSAFLALAYLSVVAGWLLDFLPVTALIGLGTIVLAVPTVIQVMRNATSIPDLIPALGKNVVINIVTPVLLAVGFFID